MSYYTHLYVIYNMERCSLVQTNAIIPESNQPTHWSQDRDEPAHEGVSVTIIYHTCIKPHAVWLNPSIAATLTDVCQNHWNITLSLYFFLHHIKQLLQTHFSFYLLLHYLSLTLDLSLCPPPCTHKEDFVCSLERKGENLLAITETLYSHNYEKSIEFEHKDSHVLCAG